MGFSARLVYSNGAWGDEGTAADAFVSIDIYDSDIATIDYRPATGRGRFYLGFQPRDYFEDPDASEPIDADAEASHFSAWAKQVLGVDVSSERLRPLLAGEGDDDPDDDFVEETVVRLIGLLRLPMPEKLADVAN